MRTKLVKKPLDKTIVSPDTGFSLKQALINNELHEVYTGFCWLVG